jgi:hypothetical protein
VTAVELDPVTAAWYQAINGWDAEIAALKEKRERAIGLIQAAMGDHDQATIGGRPAATWAWSKPGQRIDRAKLEGDYGTDVIAQYLVDNKPARPFRILGQDDQ